MQAARLCDIDVPQHLAGLAIELHDPACRSRGLLERLHAGPEDVAREFERIGAPQSGNLAQKPAAEVELLDPSVFPIRYIHRSIGVDLDGMRQFELAGAGARRAPLPYLFSVRCVLENSGIAVAVRDVEMSVGREGNIGGAAEWSGRAGLPTHHDRQ
jgi:hypothetical protein